MKRYQHRDGFLVTGPGRVLYAEVVSETEVWGVYADGQRVLWNYPDVAIWVENGWWVEIPIE